MENEKEVEKQQMKKCKFCGGVIPVNAQKCKHCGEWLVKKYGKPWKNAMLLNFFLGIFGAHRFYTGYIGIGIAQLLTFGGFFIWATIDFYSLALNKFKDSQGNSLKGYNKTAGIILAIVVALCSCSILGRMLGEEGNTQPSNSTSQAQHSVAKQSKPDLEVIEHHICNGEFGNKMICGTVVNNTNDTYSYAQVDINLYDRDNALVDSTFANISGLEANSKWKFEAPIMDERNVSTYKIKEVSGW